MRLLKFLVVIVVLALLALTGYAYLGDMAPRQQEMRQPVALDTGAPAPVAAAPAPETAPPANDAATEEPASENAEETETNGLD